MAGRAVAPRSVWRCESRPTTEAAGSSYPQHAMTNPNLRWFAIVWLEHGRVAGGYALDYKPEEKEVYERLHGANIIGDFATMAEASAAVRERIKAVAPVRSRPPRR